MEVFLVGVFKKMTSNLDYPRGNQAPERRGFYEPPSPVERDLELLAKHTFCDFQESMHTLVEEVRNPVFPLSIFYAKRDEDQVNLSVRIRTAKNKVLYNSPYLPVFRAISLANKLHSLFRVNHYGCDITREIVEDG